MTKPTTDTTILVLSSGGTFEKVYLPQDGSMGFDQTRLDQWQSNCRLPKHVRVACPFLVDSLDMSDAQRASLVSMSLQAPEQQVVIIHGTDTLTKTADALQEAFCAAAQPKTIVLTGAMVPASIPGSDALFNLGMALACVQTLAPGVWMALNGDVFAAGQAQKNHELGRFMRVMA